VIEKKRRGESSDCKIQVTELLFICSHSHTATCNFDRNFYFPRSANIDFKITSEITSEYSSEF
jgi:hypothetical protein